MQELVGSCNTSSKKLIEYMQAWQKKPTLEADLGGTLDTYVTQLNQAQEHVSYGHSNINFAEAAIFIQNWAAVYDKKVDLLLKTFIKLHTALCDISSSGPENPTEAETVDNANIAEQQNVCNPEEQPKEKNKKKKKDKNENQPDEANVQAAELPGPSTAATEGAAVESTVPFGDKSLQDSYSEKELQEIGVLWNMLNNMERKKIENILNKIDEETDQANHEETEAVDQNNTTNVEISSQSSGVVSSSAAEETVPEIAAAENTTSTESDAPSTLEPSTSTSDVNVEPAESHAEADTYSDADMGADDLAEQEPEGKEETDKTISDVPDESQVVDVKLACLRQVRVRLEYLSEEVLKEVQKKSELRADSLLKQSKTENCTNERQTACRDCTGCRALQDISSIRKRYELCAMKKKDLEILKPGRESLRRRKRSLDSNKENENLGNVLPKKIKLPEPFTVQHSAFEKFYRRCYKGLQWEGKKLTVCMEDEIENDSDMEPDAAETQEEDNKPEDCTTNTVLEDEHSTELNALVDTPPQAISEAPSKEGDSIAVEPGLPAEETDKSAAEALDSELSQPYFYPHTPAHSEDSGRYSAAAYHSDMETESQLNRTVHSDSGVEMSHQSEDEDDALSVIISNPFKDLAPPDISFYKKKCESLLEQRERDQKVREWEEFLKEKSKRDNLPTFDISEYENKILDTFPDTSSEEIPFSAVVKGRTVEEVSRFFLASLQLANMENIHLRDDSNGQISKDGLKLKCVSKKRYNDDTSRFATFLEQNFMESLSSVQSRDKFMQSTPSTSVKFKRKHASRQ